MEILIELLPYFLMALIGAILHVVKKLAKLEEGGKRFNFGPWWRRNKFRTILGLCLSLAGVFGLYELGQLTILGCLLMGFSGNSIMNKDTEKAVG